MKLFVIEKGTAVRWVKRASGWIGNYIKDYKTRARTSFEVEDIRIDPLRRHGPLPHGNTIGGVWAGNGWYRFELSQDVSKKYEMVLVHSSNVKVL